MKKQLSLGLLLLLVHVFVQAQQFKISYSPEVFNKPFTGKLFLYMSKNSPEPKEGSVGMEFFPCFSIDAANVKPGGFVVIDDKANAFPVKLSDIERGEYYVQAVWDSTQGWWCLLRPEPRDCPAGPCLSHCQVCTRVAWPASLATWRG